MRPQTRPPRSPVLRSGCHHLGAASLKTNFLRTSPKRKHDQSENKDLTRLRWTLLREWLTNAATDMTGLAKIYFIVFGLLTIVGGVIGYVKAGSTASIIAGSIAGILLLIAAWMLPGNLVLGLVLALVISIALAGRFVPAFIKTGHLMPAGLMSVLSVIGIVMAVLALIRK